VVDVVDEPDGDAAAVGVEQRVLDDLGGVVVEANVVEGQIETPLGGAQELGHLTSDVDGGLAAVAVRSDLDHACARS
jgi:hypothetical protein